MSIYLSALLLDSENSQNEKSSHFKKELSSKNSKETI